MSKEKVRVYQLARELNVESKDLIDLLKAAGTDVKNHMTTIDAETRQLAQDLLSGKVKPHAAAAAATAEAPGRAEPKRPTATASQQIPEPKSKRPSVLPKVKTAATAVKEETVAEAPPAEEPEPMIAEPAVEPAPAEVAAEQVQVEEAVAVAPVEAEPEVEIEEEPAEPPVAEAAPVEEPVVAAKAAPAPSAAPAARERPPEPQPAPMRDLGRIPPPNNARPVTLRPGGDQGEGRGPRTPRERRPLRPPRRIGLAPPPALGKGITEPPKKKPEAAPQKPVMKLPPDVMRTGQIPTAEPVSPPRVPEKTMTPDFDEAGGKGKARGTAVPGREDRQRRRGQRAEGRRKVDDEDEDSPRRGQRNRARRLTAAQQLLQRGPIALDSPITIRSFSEAVGIRSGELLKKLMRLGVMATINRTLTQEEAEMLALDLGVELQIKHGRKAESTLEESLVQAPDEPGQQIPRPPVVTFMGHVDHGKTSLMDRIRSANVVASESGGITQHIGAYQVKSESGTVTFLDTPGHEAFTAMRARGANVTDIVVLVVAADDGVMPQTEEAISHAKAAGVEIVVAVNKVDLPSANIERVRQQLSGHGLIAEDWGGDTQMISTSAATGAGIPELIDAINLVAELKELRANPERPAEGMCIEASLSEGRGVQSTMLVRNGTLRRGDTILCGSAFGRVRAMYNDQNQLIEEAGPSTPVILTGLDHVPEAGDKFFVLDDVTKAREIAESRKAKTRSETLIGRQHVTLENIFDTLQERKLRELLLIVKADVRGSLEAIRKKITDFDHEEVRVRIIHEGVGGITESDVLLADASDAIVIGFHVAPDDRAISLASEKGVEIRRYEIIYQVSDDIHKALEGMLRPESREVQLGRAVVQEIYNISRFGSIAGCRVVQGIIERNAKVRIIRDGTIIGTYPIDSLKRYKDDAKEVRDGLECGMKLAGFNDVKKGDVLEAFKIEQIKRTL